MYKQINLRYFIKFVTKILQRKFDYYNSKFNNKISLEVQLKFIYSDSNNAFVLLLKNFYFYINSIKG